MRLHDETMAKPGAGDGPVKWCRRCSRRHPKRAPCPGLVKVKRRTADGRPVERLAR